MSTSPDEQFDSEFYRRCEDRDCPVTFAYEAERKQPHWHFTGSPDHSRDPAIDAMERLGAAYEDGRDPDDPALADDWEIVGERIQGILTRKMGPHSVVIHTHTTPRRIYPEEQSNINHDLRMNSARRS